MAVVGIPMLSAEVLTLTQILVLTFMNRNRETPPVTLDSAQKLDQSVLEKVQEMYDAGLLVTLNLVRTLTLSVALILTGPIRS